MEKPNLNLMHKIILTNEDCNFNIFLKAFFDKKQFETMIDDEPHSLRVKKAPIRASLSNRFTNT